MKKILITGDSYCASKKNESWTRLLSERLQSNLTIAGEVGASLYYAYENLLNLDDNHDYYIVLVTNPGRLYFRNPPHFSNKYVATWTHETTEDVQLKLKALATKHYYETLYDEKFDNYVHQSIIEDIEDYLSVKNSVIYPNFKFSNYYTPYFTMLEITNACFSKFFKHLDRPFNFYTDIYQKFSETDNVINHTTLECQELIAEHFYQILTNGFSTVKIEDFAKLETKPFDYYFIPR